MALAQRAGRRGFGGRANPVGTCARLCYRQEIDAAWAKEAEDRIDAYERGKIESVPAEEVFNEIDRLFPNTRTGAEPADSLTA